jgi:hypothetical protein
MMNAITYKTFIAPVDQVVAANRLALNELSLRVVKDDKSKGGHHLTAVSLDHGFEISFECLTQHMTRIRVAASERLLIRNKVSAADVIMQTANHLEVRLCDVYSFG